MYYSEISADTDSGHLRDQDLLDQLFFENPRLKEIMLSAQSLEEVHKEIRQWVTEESAGRPDIARFRSQEYPTIDVFRRLNWKDVACIRLLDYLDNSGRVIEDLNFEGRRFCLNVFELLWDVANERDVEVHSDFYQDMLYLFRQFSGNYVAIQPSRETVEKWMNRHPSGLDTSIVEMRKKNKDRIIDVIIEWIDSGDKEDSRYVFEPGMKRTEKEKRVDKWWNDYVFHLRFAARDPDMLNRMLGYSLSEETIEILEQAKAVGIPFFVNPYYASLLNVSAPEHIQASDLAIREYVIYSRELVEEFGNISAWEKEDIIEDGKPNAAGWLLPAGDNVHRRYPDVAILIPHTKGRACGGLCTVCQRMYNFQKGHLNFNLENLAPRQSWREKLLELMDYFRRDSQLRDILITGGDAFMNTDASLKRILDAVYDMAVQKREDNVHRKDGEKYAEISRVRLGTRLPVYIPQRITPELVTILREFKDKASRIGISQFVVQTHFESSMEVTPEAQEGVARLQQAGWKITNQHVFTTSASRRGHVAKLRRVLAENGVLPYYTFTVKGFRENRLAYATAARTMQEMAEEKIFGITDDKAGERVLEILAQPEDAPRMLSSLMRDHQLPFLSTDRNIVNLPGVGKSLAYRVIGLTADGRRVLKFSFDHSRLHSPITRKMRSIVFVESKSISRYLQEVSDMGEDPREYESLYGYSTGITEDRFKLYDYPAYDYRLTDRLTNLKIE